jgi:hypothetical protein
LEDLLSNTNFAILDYTPKLRKARYVSDRYKELEALPAWQDYIGQIKSTRTALVSQILSPGGTADKWGKTHEEEKKAVLAFIDTLLTHIPAIHTRVAQLEDIAVKAEEQKKLLDYVPAGQIHGEDHILGSEL